MLEFQYIELRLLIFSANLILPCDDSIKKVIFRIKPVYMCSYSEIALIHDTRHVRARFRVDGIKAMPLANRINRGRVCLHCQKGTTILLLQIKCPVRVATSFYAIFDCCEDIYGRDCI